MKKQTPKKIRITLEKTPSGYSAYADDLDIYTTAENISQLYNHLLEALNLYYEDSGSHISKDQIQLHLDLQQFFQHYRVLNASLLAERIGMHPTLLSQYVHGKKSPSRKQTQKILKGIQAIGKELSDLQFIQS